MKPEQREQWIALIQRGRAGDRSAQEALVRMAQNRVYYHCKKMLKKEEDAQDATQDVLLIMITNLEKLREPAAFWGWVNSITSRRCIHQLSTPQREWQIPEDEEGGSMLDSLEHLDDQLVPEKALDNEETRRMLLDLVDALPPEQRMTVLFYYYDEMSVRAIAQAMGTSEGTVKSRLNYARRAIKRGVKDYERQGVKLYSASPLILLVYALGQEGAGTALPAPTAAAMAGQVMAASGKAAVGAGMAGAAGGGIPAAAGAASAASAIAAKAVVGLLAGTVVVGGIGLGIAALANRDTPRTSPRPSEAVSMPWARPTDDPGPAPTPAGERTVYAAYQDELAGRRDRIDAYAGWYEAQGGVRPVILADIYGDETPELICIEAAGESPEDGSVLTVLTWQEGRTVNLLSEPWDNTGGIPLSYTLYQTEGDKALYAHTGYNDGGIRVVTRYCLEETEDGPVFRQVESPPHIERVLLSNATEAPEAMTSAEAAAFLAGGGDG